MTNDDFEIAMVKMDSQYKTMRTYIREREETKAILVEDSNKLSLNDADKDRLLERLERDRYLIECYKNYLYSFIEMLTDEEGDEYE